MMPLHFLDAIPAWVYLSGVFTVAMVLQHRRHQRQMCELQSAQRFVGQWVNRLDDQVLALGAGTDEPAHRREQFHRLHRELQDCARRNQAVIDARFLCDPLPEPMRGMAWAPWEAITLVRRWEYDLCRGDCEGLAADCRAIEEERIAYRETWRLFLYEEGKYPPVDRPMVYGGDVEGVREMNRILRDLKVRGDALDRAFYTHCIEVFGHSTEDVQQAWGWLYEGQRLLDAEPDAAWFTAEQQAARLRVALQQALDAGASAPQRRRL